MKEKTCLLHPGVKEAAVIGQESEKGSLLGYYRKSEESLTVKEVVFCREAGSFQATSRC